MSNFENIVAIVLAAGKGKRMNSDLPKVLHTIAGKPLVKHVTDMLFQLGLSRIVLVVGHGREYVMAYYNDNSVSFVIQPEQRGTADAVKTAAEFYRDASCEVLVLFGDVPLLSSKTLKRLVDTHYAQGNEATVLTSIPDKPDGYGRIIRDGSGNLMRIVEEKDASDEERVIREINTGIFIFASKPLYDCLQLVDNNNAQREFYLTDVIHIMLSCGMKTGAMLLDDYREALGVNKFEELQQLEKVFFELNR